MNRNKPQSDSQRDHSNETGFVKPGSPKFTKIQELVYELKVCDAMKQDIITTTPDTSMSELREILRSNRISGTPVMEGDKMVGVISIEDFIMWLASGEDDCPISDKMTTDVATMFATEPLIHAVSKLEKTGYGRFPIIDRKSGKLVGIIAKRDIIERLLRKLEIEYHEEEIHRYRASHIFEDIIGEKVAITFQSAVIGKDFKRAGEASSGLKKTLERLGIHPHIVRRAAIASYEAEMNLVIYTDGGAIDYSIDNETIFVTISDSGPGIEDIEKAMQPGYTTSAPWVKELGFGAGMGLPNIKKCSDEMEIEFPNAGFGCHVRLASQAREKKAGKGRPASRCSIGI